MMECYIIGFQNIKKTKNNTKNKEICILNKERYGYFRITLRLRNQGYEVNHEQGYRIKVNPSLNR